MERFQPLRAIRPELLDQQEPGGGERSLSDLVRINRYLGGYAVLRRTLRRLVRPGQSFALLDIGSATGDTGAQVRSQYPGAFVVSLDYRVHHLSPANGPRVAADAFHLPFAAGSFDFAHCSLFLHHFRDADVIALLRSFGKVARQAVIVNDLERHWIPYYFLPATGWMFRWDAITLHDGPISVQAGWRAAELRRLALKAGFSRVSIEVHRPAFRIAMVAHTRQPGTFENDVKERA